MSKTEDEIIKDSINLERESREIREIVGVIADNAHTFIENSLTVDRIKKKVLEDGCNKPFFFPDGSKLTLEIKLTLGEKVIKKKITKKKTKKKSVKKTGKL